MKPWHNVIHPSRPFLAEHPIRPVLEFGGGIEYKLTDKFNIALEDKVSISKSDLLDGQEWQETGSTTVHATDQ